MKKAMYFLSIFLVTFLVLRVSCLKSEESFLSKQEVDNVEKGAYNTEEEMSVEINQLYSQLDELRQQLDKSAEDNTALNQQLEAYKQKANSYKNKADLLKNIQNLALKPNLSIQQLQNINYKNAYYALSLGNIKASQLKFIKFLNATATDFSEHKSAVAGLENKEEKLKDFNTKWQLDKDKANFFLGELYLLQSDYKNSLKYLSDAYRFSNDYDIVVYSLLGIIESFESENKSQEACLTLKSLKNAVDTIKKSGTAYELPENLAVTLATKYENNDCGKQSSTISKTNTLPTAANPAPQANPKDISVGQQSIIPELSPESSSQQKKNVNNSAPNSHSNTSVSTSTKTAPQVQEKTSTPLSVKNTSSNTSVKTQSDDSINYVGTSELYPTSSRTIRTTLPGSAPVTEAEKKELASQPKKPPPNLQAPKIPQDAYEKLDKNYEPLQEPLQESKY